MLYQTRKDDEYKENQTTQNRDYSVKNNSNPYSGKLSQIENQGAPKYTESPEVTDRKQQLTQIESAKPPTYVRDEGGYIQQLTDEILNRKPFSYDFNADPVYQQYKDSFIHNGKVAMMDTAAQAANLSGGYANSYAASAGNQAYQNYLLQLQDVLPELYQAAYNRYVNEETSKRNNLNMLNEQENFKYGIYRDQVGDWQSDRSYAYGAYGDAWNRDYGKYRDDVSDYYSQLDYIAGRHDKEDANYMWDSEMKEKVHQYDNNFNYQKYRDSVSDSQWQKSFDYQKEQDDFTRKLQKAAEVRAERELKLKENGASSYATPGNVQINDEVIEKEKGRSWITEDELGGIIRAAKEGEKELVTYITDLNLTDEKSNELYKKYRIEPRLSLPFNK